MPTVNSKTLQQTGANMDINTGSLEVEESLDDFMTMYAAGNATTSTTLLWSLGQLTRNPGVLEKVVEEVSIICTFVVVAISRRSVNVLVARYTSRACVYQNCQSYLKGSASMLRIAFFIEFEINLSRKLKVPTIRDTCEKFEQVDSVWADANIDGNTDTSVIGDTLKQMVYLEAFVKEVLRFHPPVQFINRECSKKVKVCGYDIPAGTGVSFFFMVFFFVF